MENPYNIASIFDFESMLNFDKNPNLYSSELYGISLQNEALMSNINDTASDDFLTCDSNISNYLELEIPINSDSQSILDENVHSLPNKNSLGKYFSTYDPTFHHLQQVNESEFPDQSFNCWTVNESYFETPQVFSVPFQVDASIMTNVSVEIKKSRGRPRRTTEAKNPGNDVGPLKILYK